MLAQVAVVATDTGGTAEINNPEELCLIVPPDDYLALAKAIDSLRLDDKFRQELIDKAYKQVASKYTLAPAARAWEKIFLTLINKE
jgi:glycosyltransferase involved in cell wall biosynthesis